MYDVSIVYSSLYIEEVGIASLINKKPKGLEVAIEDQIAQMPYGWLDTVEVISQISKSVQ